IIIDALRCVGDDRCVIDHGVRYRSHICRASTHRTGTFASREVFDMSRGSGVDGRPRMVDVGRLANVSAQTVSRYFTGGYVAPVTRERIERAVAELSYRPNPAARRLKSNRADSIGVIAMGHP